VAEGEGKFEGQSGAKEEDGLTDACLAELDALGSAGDAKLLAAGSGKGASDGNEAVAVSIVFDDGENLIFPW
jgi:HEAT repeat protein